MIDFNLCRSDGAYESTIHNQIMVGGVAMAAHHIKIYLSPFEDPD